MGNELFCCSDEKSPAANSGLVSSKERRRGMLPLQSITEVTSVSEQPTIKILLPTPTAHQRHTGKSLPSEHDRLRDSCLSNSKSERPNKCRPHVARQSHYDKVASLGVGGFGKVFLVRPKTSGCANASDSKKCPSSCGDTPYAMKVIPKKKIDREELSLNNLMLQRKILATMKSNFIVDLKCAFQNHKSLFFVMDYAPGGDLYSFLDNPYHPGKVKMFKALGEHGVRFVTGCVVLALEALHSCNIIYRDLKPENVLVFHNGYLKLCDFGLAEEHSEDKKIQTLVAGTKIYLAPEIVDDGACTKLIDLWALGIFIHELVFCKPPFPVGMIVPNRFKKIARKAEINRTWPQATASPQVKDLIDKLLKVKPHDRLGAKSFNDIKQHPFFEGFSWEKLYAMHLESPLQRIVEEFGTGSAKHVDDHQTSSDEGQEGPHLPHFTYHHEHSDHNPAIREE